MSAEIISPEKVELKKYPNFNEAVLQDYICEDPTRLGLGEMDVLGRERSQEAGGRLDILLSDTDKNRRYEVEIMLGATDPSHIVRCIEYWDIERRRYPAYEHVAVLIAEEITTRFLNVLSLMSGTIPLIAIQLDALKVGDQLVLSFVHILNQTALRVDDTEDNGGGEDVDRSYWIGRVGESILGIGDRVLEIINEKAKSTQQLSYKKRYLGLKSGMRTRNFVVFSLKKSFVHIRTRINNSDEWMERLENEGLLATSPKTGSVRITVKPEEFKQHETIIRELIHQAVEEYQS